MKQDNPIQKKSFSFALNILQIQSLLSRHENAWILSKQLIKSGTSIGANVEEALGAQSRKEFISKLSISYKEARESRYWLLLLHESKIIESNKTSILLDKVDELCRILGKIISTSISNSRVKNN